MSLIRIVSAVGISVIFTGLLLAVIFYLNEKNSNSSTLLGPASDWAWLGLAGGAICGLIIGGISGAVITGFQLNPPKALLFGLVFNLFLDCAFYIISGGGWNDSLTYDALAMPVVGMINGAIVSFVGVGSKSLE